MKKTIIFLLFSFILASCGNDDDEKGDKVKTFNNYITGTWVSSKYNFNSVKRSVVLIFNKDKTACIYGVKSINENVYDLADTTKILNYSAEYLDGGEYRLILKYQDHNSVYESSLQCFYIDADSLLMDEYGKMIKVSSINIKE